MLNPFPDLLVLGFFAPTMLRVAAAIAFLFVIHHQWQHREAVSRIPFPVVGTRLGMAVVWLAVAAEFAVAGLLLVGLYTQFAALAGMLLAAAFFYLSKRWPTFAPLSRGASALLFIVLASLLLSGAGAFAYDLPL